MVPKPQADLDGALFCYALTEDAWVVGGAVSNGGIVVRWAGGPLVPDLRGTLEGPTADEQLLAQGEGGSVINISSVSGFRPQPNNIAYVAAKHGVVGMTKVAALEYGPQNIRVNSVTPGAIDTPMLRGALEQTGISAEDFAPQLSLLNRFGQAREIAEGSLWLASDASSYVTGITLHVDAGYVGR